MNGFLVFLLLLNAYIVILYFLHRATKLRGKVDLVGPLVMWKTQAGKRTIDRVAAWSPRAWRAWGDAAIWVTWAAGLFVLFILLYQLYLTITAPRLVAETALPPEYLLGLPGVNPLIPIGYGIVGLAIALVIHEGSHGVLARAGNLGVKSLGLLFFIVPVGAFVEPDEKDLEGASTRAKNRVFAAGPMSNIALALVAGLVFSSVFMGSVAVADDRGVLIGTVVGDSPAFEAGLRPADRLVSIDGESMRDLDAFNAYMNRTKPDQIVTLEFFHDGKRTIASAKLDDKYEYANATLADLPPEQRAELEDDLAEFRGKGFLGVNAFGMEYLGAIRDRLADPFYDGPLGAFNPRTGGSFIFYTSYPFFALIGGTDIMAEPFREYLVVEGPLAALPTWAFFMLANMMYWLFWLNLMLGTFNALPMGPLDGGQMFRATLRERLLKRYGVDPAKLRVEHELGVPGARTTAVDPETQVKLDRVNVAVKRATWTVGFSILGMILIPIIVPRIVPFFL